MGRRAVLFRCHYVNRPIADAFRKLQADCDDDVFLLYDATKKPLDFSEGNAFVYREADMRKPGRPFRDLWYHSDYPLLLFRSMRPEYDFYWQIEYDVRFTGVWRDFFDAVPNCDFAASHMIGLAACRDWPWWQERGFIRGDERRFVKCFFPAVGFSNRALQTLDYHRGRGANGFCEWAVPTILSLCGLNLCDFGGDGEFTPPELRDRFYSEETFHWKPEMEQAGNVNDTLYHPVREQTND